MFECSEHLRNIVVWQHFCLLLTFDILCRSMEDNQDNQDNQDIIEQPPPPHVHPDDNDDDGEEEEEVDVDVDVEEEVQDGQPRALEAEDDDIDLPMEERRPEKHWNIKIPDYIFIPKAGLDYCEEVPPLGHCNKNHYDVLKVFWTMDPCSKFDIVPGVNDPMSSFPDWNDEVTILAGTQADHPRFNSLTLARMVNINGLCGKYCECQEELTEPYLVYTRMRHLGRVNKVKVTRFREFQLAATWSELGSVHIYNISEPLRTLNEFERTDSTQNNLVDGFYNPLFSFEEHGFEGYALDWSTTEPGLLATGDCRDTIHILTGHDGGTWTKSQEPLIGHDDSVEDVKWSPMMIKMLASCSSDRTIKLWDLRVPERNSVLTAEETHLTTTTTLAWHPKLNFIASGGFDGYIRVWDIRKFEGNSPVNAVRNCHKPITSMDWHPERPGMLAVGSSQHKINVWDLKDFQTHSSTKKVEHRVPPGTTELNWHPKMSSLLVAATPPFGFCIMKSSSL